MITLFRYTLPFARPVPTRHGPLAARTGLLVRDGKAWGEAAPWPGLSPESLGEAEAELQSWRECQASGRDFSPQLSSVAFAFDSVTDQVGTARRTVRQTKTTSTTPTKIPINALLSDEPLDTALPSLISSGFRTVKIKVGRQSIRADAGRVKEVHRQLGPDIKLRLDANRAWTLTDAVDFAKSITGVPLEYIEEPLQNPAELPAFHARSGLPVALDEALLEQPLEYYRAWRGVRVVVIKPTILGGLRAAKRLAVTATELGWLPVFSAVYESGVGIRALAQLAARCGAPGVAMGFDTYRCLADDVLQPRLTIRDGALDLLEADHAEVCFGKLQVLP
jgi:O-succinylbenzoate synthase